MSPFSQISEFISCTSNVRFVFLGLEANWGCIASFSGAIFIIILFLVYLLFLIRQDANHDEPQKIAQPDSSSPRFQQLLKGSKKMTDSGNLLPLLLDLQQQQHGLKVDVDKALTTIAGLNQSLKPISELTQRLDRILSGAQSKGAFGEQIIGERLSQLPPEWVARNEKFADGKVVEFCLRAPNGQLIPIDSKWTATELLDQLGQTADKEQRDAIVKQIRSEVVKRAQEVLKYRDVNRTMGFCIAAVPDPVFEHCLDIQPRLVAANIVLISYSLLVPYILLIVKLFWSNAQSAQALQIAHVLNRSILQIGQIQQEIDTQVRGPLDAVKLQQSQYIEYNQQLQTAYAKLSQIQNDLNAVQSLIPNSISTLPHDQIAAIPDTLQHRLTQVRKDLFEGAPRQDSSTRNETNQ